MLTVGHVYKIFKIFKSKNLSNLHYVQYFMGALSVNNVLDLRKLSFLQKQSAHRCTPHISIASIVFTDW